ncbi:MAG: ABC transporter ATP-binding protein [Thermomicrobiales bacterium]
MAGAGTANLTPPLLLLEDIRIRGDNRLMLDVPRLSLADGERIAVIGPNGAGKTTLLHVAALLRQPSSGQITFQGERVTVAGGANARQAISVVFQHPLLFATSVLANAAAGLRFTGVPRAEAAQRARIWLDRFGVAPLADRRARRLSGGEAARVALARAFATEPALLLLDEPFSALDAPSRAVLLPELTDHLRGTGAAAMLITHDLDEAFTFGDRIVVLHEGRIAAAGFPADLLVRPPTCQVAELLGIENILWARVRAVAGGHAAIELPHGGATLRVNVPLAQTIAPGRAVTLTFPGSAVVLLRPEQPSPPGWNRVEGVVSAAQPTPSGLRVSVATPDTLVAITPWQPGSPGWREGERAAVAIAPDAVNLINEPR